MDGAYFDIDGASLAAFQDLTRRSLDPSELSFAADVHKNVPVYDAAALRSALADPSGKQALMGEWAHVLGKLSGALVLRGALTDGSVIDAVTGIYQRIITREKEEARTQADHFATAGANDRVWNALQKLCDEDPELFARYFGNPVISAVCEAWLGPAYQMTAQINLVRPGGQAQEAHRDYHLGFQTAEVAGRFPAHAHDLSAVMTLQGGIAHCDMPIESGPTKLLPFSQLFRAGYMAYRRDDFRAYFEEAHIQLPLSKGDAIFFNPALFHAAGENRSADIQRMANLLQISSAFGRAMETVDREGMCKRLYSAVLGLAASGALDPAEVDAAIAAAAEGYSFPTNLDSDPPKGGLAPETQAGLFHRALAEGMSAERFEAELSEQTARRTA